MSDGYAEMFKMAVQYFIATSCSHSPKSSCKSENAFFTCVKKIATPSAFVILLLCYACLLVDFIAYFLFVFLSILFYFMNLNSSSCKRNKINHFIDEKLIAVFH